MSNLVSSQRSIFGGACCLGRGALTFPIRMSFSLHSSLSHIQYEDMKEATSTWLELKYRVLRKCPFDSLKVLGTFLSYIQV